jgi:hypothetical protein
MNVLSLFDGMSCGQIALDKLDIEVENYFASEIDKYAIKVTQANYPNTKHIGDVTKVKGEDLPKIDLLIGGSPCQGFILPQNRNRVYWTNIPFELPKNEMTLTMQDLLETNVDDKYYITQKMYNCIISSSNKGVAKW